MVKNLPAHTGDARDMDLIPGLGRFPGGGNGNLLQYSCLEIFHRQEDPGRLQRLKRDFLSMYTHRVNESFPGGLVVKSPPASAGDTGEAG